MRDTGRILITLLAAAVTYGLTRVAVPGADELFAASASLRYEDARPYSIAEMGLLPFLAASVLVEIASFVIPSWRKAREAGGAADLPRRRVAVALGGVFALGYGWSCAGSLVDLARDIAPIDVPVWTLALTLAAASAFLWSIASLVDERGLGSGFALVHGLTRIAIFTEMDGSIDYLGIAVLFGFPIALAVWALTWDRAMPDAPSGSSTVRLRLPEPTGGLLGLGLAMWLLDAAFAAVGDPALKEQAETFGAGAMGWQWLTLGAALAGACGVGAALLLDWPSRVARFWSRAAPGAPYDDLRSAAGAEVVETGVRTGMLCAAAFAIMSALSTDGFGFELEGGLLLGVALVEAIRDLRTRRVRVPVDEDTRPWAVVAKVEALRRAGIDAISRNRGIVTIFPIAGPLLPIVVETPHEDVHRARELLDGMTAESSEVVVAPAARVERAPRGAIALVVASLLLAGGFGAQFVIAGVRGAQEAAAAPVEPISFRMAVLDDESDPFAAWGRNPRLGPEGVVYRLEDAPLGRGRTEPRTYAYVEPAAGETMEQARDRVHSDLAAELPPGRMLAWGKVGDFDPEKNEFVMVGYRTYIVMGQAVLTEADVRDATIEEEMYDTGPQVSVSIFFSREGGEAFAAATEANIYRRIALIAEGEVMSAPVVQSKIEGGIARITMGRSPIDQQRTDAERLARGLRAAARKR